MPERQIIQDSFMMKFIRTGVGEEESLVRHLRKMNKNSYHFKIFGRYDVLEITRLDALHNALRAHTDHRIRSISSFPFFCWHNKIDEFVTSLEKSLSPAVSLLKLQDVVFQKKGLAGLLHLIMMLKKKHHKDKNFHVLVGMGYYEVFLWLPSANLDSTFEVANKVRNYRIIDFFPDFAPKYAQKPLFADTTTIPVISYPNVIAKNKWDDLSGNVSPLVKVKCPPGLEALVAQKWSDKWFPLLGSDDMLCSWQEASVPLGSFVKELCEHRKEWGKITCALDTTTKIYGPRYSQPKITYQIPKAQKAKGTLTKLLTELSSKAGEVNQFLISESINIVSLIYTHVGSDGEISKTYYDIMCSIQYLGILLTEYDEAVSKEHYRKIAGLERELFAYINCIRTAMHQHFPSKDYSEFSDASNGVPYSGSLSRIIRAISVIPEQLLGIISQSTPPSRLKSEAEKAQEDKRKHSLTKCLNDFEVPWKGFVSLHLAEGYQLLNQGEVIIVPYRDIFEILNWQTITHEVSHAYYARIQLDEVEESWIKSWPGYIAKAKPDIDVPLKKITDELFAHWFDFRHFFLGEFEFYVWSIWKTWLSISKVHNHPVEYWHRTLFIRIASKYQSLNPKAVKIRRSSKAPAQQMKDLCQLFESELQSVEAYLKSKFPKKYTDIELDHQQRKSVLQLMANTYDMLNILEEHGYYNEKLAQAFHETNDAQAKLINMVINGEIPTNTIKNPYSLLHSILRHSFNNELPPSDPVTIATIFTLWEASRSFARIPSRRIL